MSSRKPIVLIARDPLPSLQLWPGPAKFRRSPLPGRALTMPIRLPSESLNHAPSPPSGVWGVPVVCPRLLGIVVFELDPSTPHLLDNGPHVGDVKNGLGELPYDLTLAG